MRNILYVLGLLTTAIGAVMTYSQLPDPMPSSMAAVVIANETLALQRMLIVVCGVLLFVGGAIVGAIDALRAPMPMQPQQQWPVPMQGPPASGHG